MERRNEELYGLMASQMNQANEKIEKQSQTINLLMNIIINGFNDQRSHQMETSGVPAEPIEPVQREPSVQSNGTTILIKQEVEDLGNLYFY